VKFSDAIWHPALIERDPVSLPLILYQGCPKYSDYSEIESSSWSDLQFWIIHYLKISRRQNSMKSSPADSRVNVWKFWLRPLTGEVRIPSRDRVEWRSTHHRAEHLFTSFGFINPPVALWRWGRGHSLKQWRTLAPWFGCVPKRILLNFG